jgi:RNA polymerase-binding protein DksA
MRDLEFFRTLLRDQRSDALSSVAELGGAIEAIVSARQDSNSDDEHDPEGATLAFERSQSDALLRQTVQRLRDIDASLARLDAGTYGRCEVCGEPIGRARLEARPYARTCIRCADSAGT